MSARDNWAKERKNEKIGGGWFVFRRHSTSGRIYLNANGKPFEHPSEEEANKEARRLAALHPNKVFCVLQVREALMSFEGKAEAFAT